MRRQTNTVNWSTGLPLAQGIEFGGSGGPPRGTDESCGAVARMER